MEIVSCQDSSMVVVKADAWCAQKIAQYQPQRLFLPSGATPQQLYQHWEAIRPDFLNGLQLTQLDEITSGPKAGSFRAFFEKELPSYLPQFLPIEQQMEAPDLVILGLGMNGHVAFHEPHVREDLYRGYVNLAEDTCERLGVDYRTRAITYGVKCFLQAKAILLLVQGVQKKAIFQEFLQAESRLPAALLKGHKDFTVLASADLL